MSSGNEKALNMIDSAVYCITLDDDVVGDDKDRLFKLFLHGNANGNRWFDKSVSLHFTGDGKAAVTFEHSWGDGVAVLRFFNEMFEDATKRPRVDASTVPASIGENVLKR